MPGASEQVYIALGSNLGDRVAIFDQARQALQEAGGRLLSASSLFETEPVGYQDQPWFLNQVLELETGLSPRELLHSCLDIEASCGRTRGIRNGPRTLDLDILLFGQITVNEPGLIIPHSRMTERRFVLEPLAEIAPEVYHPVLNKTIRHLLSVCPDSSTVRRYTPGEDS